MKQITVLVKDETIVKIGEGFLLQQYLRGHGINTDGKIIKERNDRYGGFLYTQVIEE